MAERFINLATMEPIDIAKEIIQNETEYENVLGKKTTSRTLDVSEIREIAQYLLVYCENHQEE